MIDKNKMPVAVGVAFVWFTTQFGGGFASGAQLVQYFVAFGIWALITPILAQAIGAVFQWYGLRYAKLHDAYDYRTFNNKFYGKFAPIFFPTFMSWYTYYCFAWHPLLPLRPEAPPCSPLPESHIWPVL